MVTGDGSRAVKRGERRNDELDHVSGGTSGFIYAVIAGANKGVTESALAEYKALGAAQAGTSTGCN